VFGIKVRSHFTMKVQFQASFVLKVGASLMCVSFGAKGLRIGLLFITV